MDWDHYVSRVMVGISRADGGPEGSALPEPGLVDLQTHGIPELVPGAWELRMERIPAAFAVAAGEMLNELGYMQALGHIFEDGQNAGLNVGHFFVTVDLFAIEDTRTLMVKFGPATLGSGPALAAAWPKAPDLDALADLAAAIPDEVVGQVREVLRTLGPEDLDALFQLGALSTGGAPDSDYQEALAHAKAVLGPKVTAISQLGDILAESGLDTTPQGGVPTWVWFGAVVMEVLGRGADQEAERKWGRPPQVAETGSEPPEWLAEVLAQHADDEPKPPADLIGLNSLKEQTQNLLNSLGPKERAALDKRFGRGDRLDGDPETRAKIAEIERRAQDKLRGD